MAKAEEILREKTTDEYGNIRELVIWKCGQAAANLRESDTAWHSSAVAKGQRQCCTTTIIPKDTIGT